jgi:hypothetical protein
MIRVGAFRSEVKFGFSMSRQPQQPQIDPQAPQPGSRQRRAERRRALGVALSIATHALIVVLLLFAPSPAPKVFEPQPITVELVNLPPEPVPAPTPAPSPKRPSPAKRVTRKAVAKHAPTRPAPVKPVSRHAMARPKPAARNVETLEADEEPTGGTNAELNESQLAGAADAGSGGGGGGSCDMAARLQAVLRKDRLVRDSVAGYTGKAIMVWDGDWIWMRGDIGRGLTAVRQAMAFEIAFAPEACRSARVHGLVVFSLNGAQGPVRLAVGQGDWRWTDLLSPRGTPLRR